MQQPLIQYGSNGKYVVQLQELLNEWNRKNGRSYDIIETDGDFGPKTRDAVKSYQLAMFLRKDGKVGNMTWSALLGIEMYNCFDLPSPFVKAPNQYQCWAGATAMELKQPTPNTTRPPGVQFESLAGGAVGGIENSHANMRKFANFHGMQMFEAEKLTCLQLTNLIDQFGRLMLNIKGVNSSMQNGTADDSHLVNLVGARGTGQPDGTTMTIYNPSGEFGTGVVITASYKYLKAVYPKLTYQVFYKFENRSTPVN